MLNVSIHAWPRPAPWRWNEGGQLWARSARLPFWLWEVWSRLSSRLECPGWEDQDGRKHEVASLGVCSLWPGYCKVILLPGNSVKRMESVSSRIGYCFPVTSKFSCCPPHRGSEEELCYSTRGSLTLCNIPAEGE